MEITQSSSITININGKNYNFDTPHDIEVLIGQLQAENDSIALYQMQIGASQSRITDLNAQITALCLG